MVEPVTRARLRLLPNALFWPNSALSILAQEDPRPSPSKRVKKVVHKSRRSRR